MGALMGAHFALPTKCSRIFAAETAPASRPPVCLISAMSLLIRSPYSSSNGIGQYFSPAARPAAIMFSLSCSSLQKKPVIVLPSATTIAPVKVAKSIIGERPSCTA